MDKKYAGVGSGLGAVGAGIGLGYSNSTDNRIAALEKKLRELEQRETGPVTADGHAEHPDTVKLRELQKLVSAVVEPLIKYQIEQAMTPG